ncbi:hypothetical protein AAMO2058_000354200 [Amorphochlora amoebiformis]
MEPGLVELALEENPFVHKECGWKIQENWRLQEIERRRAFNSLSIFEKSKQASTVDMVKSNILPSRQRARKKLLEKSHKGARARMMEYKDQEDLASFIKKKRQMCLTNMDITRKRHEMKRLEEKLTSKEGALHRSQLMLEEDSMRFDAFLRDIHEKVNGVENELEEEELRLGEKDARIQQLQFEIRRGEDKVKEQQLTLAVRKKYKDFLSKLTPDSHLMRVEALRRVEVRRILVSEPSVTANDIELPARMFFVEPEQLREVFQKTEERNLISMKLLQNEETALESLKKVYNSRKIMHEAKTENLDHITNNLENVLAAQNAKLLRLSEMESEQDYVLDPKRFIKRISEYVHSIYSEVMPTSAPVGVDLIAQLKQMELWVDKLMLRVNSLGENERKNAERKNEAKKRKVMVQNMAKEKQRMIEERKAKAIARIHSSTLKRAGRILMRRSPPLNRKNRDKLGASSQNSKQNAQKKKEEDENRKFFTVEEN